MSYPPPPPGGYPMYGAPPMPGGGSQYPAPGPALGFDGIANQPPVGAPGVCNYMIIENQSASYP